jgi:putative flippase GtrA
MNSGPDVVVGEAEEGTYAFVAAHVILARYVIFAAIAGLANLAAQEFVVRIAPSRPLMTSVLVGTGVGFLVKYALEKRWVFFDRYEGHGREIRKIVVYGFFGVGTTVLFWAIELAAWQLWQTTAAKYAGAALGLSVGNWLKYVLDKHFVFQRKSDASAVRLGTVSGRGK